MEFEILKGLNEEQQEAVTSIDGYIRVIAGAGSGKTKALTHRYAFLVDECGISPSSILCVTFTNKAAQEMKERIRNMIGDKDLGYICTFHGLCVRILREDIHYLNYPSNFTILDQEDQKLLLKDVYETLDINDYTQPFSNAFTEIAKSKSDHLSYYVSNVTDPNGFNPQKSNLFSEYLKLQRKNYALDFNDLLYFTIYLLNNFDSVKDKWQSRFEYIQVDEFQDVSKREYDLITLLSEKHKNLFIVGDPDQTIYSWRGSKVEYILNFDKQFDKVQNISMLKNYRSNKDIIENSNSLISHNKNRLSKSLIAATDNQVNNSYRVVHFHSKTQKEESEWIAQKIKSLNSSGYENKDIAILYRSRYAVPALEDALRKAEIHYKICDGISFYSRKEIRTILAYFNFILKQDDMSFKKIINVPSREIGTTKMRFLKKFSEENNCTLFESLKNNIGNPIFTGTKAKEFLKDIDFMINQYTSLKVSEILNLILSLTGYELKLMTKNDDEEFNVIAELKKQVSIMENDRGEKMSLQDYLDEISLSTSFDSSEEKPCVSLMTIHSAKGLEFKVVFVCEMNEGTFPTIRTDTREKMEEERRLAYVALTRAQEILFLTDAESSADGNYSSRITSRFLQNISSELFDRLGSYSECYDKKKASQSIFDSENHLDKIQSHDIGENIVHPMFGEGKIIDINISNDTYKIDFKGDLKLIERNMPLKTITEDAPSIKHTVDTTQTIIENDTFSIGDIVEHRIFGRGNIININLYKHEYTVKFEKYETERKIYDISKLILIEKGSIISQEQDILGLKKSTGDFAINDKVLHQVFGFGVIKKVFNNEYIIEFVTGIEKNISKTTHLTKIKEEQYYLALKKVMVICPECNTELHIKDRVCPECGYEFGG